jgi:hypothetical protein
LTNISIIEWGHTHNNKNKKTTALVSQSCGTYTRGLCRFYQDFFVFLRGGATWSSSIASWNPGYLFLQLIWLTFAIHFLLLQSQFDHGLNPWAPPVEVNETGFACLTIHWGFGMNDVCLRYAASRLVSLSATSTLHMMNMQICSPAIVLTASSLDDCWTLMWVLLFKKIQKLNNTTPFPIPYYQKYNHQ